MSFDFSQTYLYKMHRLTNSLDQAFDTALHQSAGIGLSQFNVLLAVDQLQPASQANIARFLDISPAAVSRQTDICVSKGWIEIVERDGDNRTRELRLTADGTEKIRTGINGLEDRVFDVFKDDSKQTTLMNHIETLQRRVDSL